MVAAPAMAAVNEEKVSRVVEVVLSSVSTAELMAGKIIGSAIAGFAQMFIWLIPVVLITSGSLPLIVALSELNIQLDISMLAYFLLNYLIGVLTFLSIFSAFGAMFDTPQDAQSSMFPVMLLIVVPFFLAFSVVNNPTSMLGVVGSMLPFFAILVMPARMVLIDVPLWQFALAVLVNLATLYFVVLLCGKIYRFTILMTGKQPSWKEIYKWIRYS
jgi:ABC-2 type transport system permease protein